MKKTKIFLSLIAFLAVMLFSINVYAENEIENTIGDIETAGTTGTEDTTKWSDFSKAECKLEYAAEDDFHNVDLIVSNAEYIEGHLYYYFFTSGNQEPADYLDKLSDDTMIHYGVGGSENYKIRAEKYVELNQDLYLWILEEQGSGDQKEYKFVIEGEKLERPEYLKYHKLFSYTFLAEDSDQLVFNVPWGKDTQRKINLKIGKVTDIELLKKIKNNTDEGIKSLLEYSKTAKSIYDKQLNSTAYGSLQDYGYSTLSGGEKIQLSLENDAYYFIYAELDDENGKYYPVEGITLGRANVSSIGSYWSIFFLGKDNFTWDIKEDSSIPTTTKDTTVATMKLPNTGIAIIATVIATILVVNAGLGIYKYNKYREVK